MHEYLPQRRLRGGLRLAAHKERSTTSSIRRGLVPERIVLSLHQGRGEPALPVVAVGERVLRGQPVAEPSGVGGTAVHASTSGRVVAIEPCLVPSFSSVAMEPCVIVDADGRDRAAPAMAAPWPADRSTKLGRIAAGGIVGLGGAAFPTAAKLGAADCHTLIVNGAECEPYISCDDMLMREFAAEIVDGTGIMAEIAGVSSSIIAVERDKPLAIEALRDVLEDRPDTTITLAEVPSIYPAGGERQLIDALAGIEVPSASYPSELGFICQNVGTAFALYRLAMDGEPLIRRIVTVSGAGIAEACNVEVPIGTPIAEIVAFCGGYTDDAVRLIHGGSMMGYALPDDTLPITKSTNCLIVPGHAQVRSSYREWPCIRCGECSIACPARLMPQDLLIESRTANMQALEAQGLTDCIECGCCDVICPSQIPLTEIFRNAKNGLAAWIERQRFSEESEHRYQQRQQREHEATEREHAARATLQSHIDEPDIGRQAIAAAVERARRKRAGTGKSDA